MKKIPCSVGILTFNSERTLRRALESVKDFSNVIISDGGSTDATLAIAAEYNCMVIDQYTKNNPGPNKYHPIKDFARERNIMLKEATEDWYLWIDSDEYISKELHSEIKEICLNKNIIHFTYEIPISLQSPDAKITYKRTEVIYQIRFFNLGSGGKFERFMHERFVFDRDKFTTGQLKGVWYVPLSKPDFVSYSRAVNYRIRVMLKNGKPRSFVEYIKRGVYIPVKRTLGVFYRLIINRIKYKSSEAMPLFYYRNQLYSNWVTFRVVTELYFKS